MVNKIVVRNMKSKIVRFLQMAINVSGFSQKVLMMGVLLSLAQISTAQETSMQIERSISEGGRETLAQEPPRDAGKPITNDQNSRGDQKKIQLNAAPSTPDLYRINPGDVLHVYVWNEPELSLEVLVQPDGNFSFPMLGTIHAGGNSSIEIANTIRDGLGAYLQDQPLVTVSVMSISGNQVYVLGKVARPGQFTLNSNVDVMQALALAGGLTTFADGKDIKILRRDALGKSEAISFDYDRVKKGKSLESNIVLKSGDLLVVP